VEACPDKATKRALKVLCDLFAVDCMMKHRDWYLEQVRLRLFSSFSLLARFLPFCCVGAHEYIPALHCSQQCQ